MPKVNINTYSNLEFEYNGKIVTSSVKKIFSEDEVVANITKEVGVFDKYSSKKSINSLYKADRQEENVR